MAALPGKSCLAATTLGGTPRRGLAWKQGDGWQQQPLVSS